MAAVGDIGNVDTHSTHHDEDDEDVPAPCYVVGVVEVPNAGFSSISSYGCDVYSRSAHFEGTLGGDCESKFVTDGGLTFTW